MMIKVPDTAVLFLVIDSLIDLKSVHGSLEILNNVRPSDDNLLEKKEKYSYFVFKKLKNDFFFKWKISLAVKTRRRYPKADVRKNSLFLVKEN